MADDRGLGRPLYDLCAAVGVETQDTVGCSKPFVSGGVAHLVLSTETNDHSDGLVDNHFITVVFDETKRSSSSNRDSAVSSDGSGKDSGEAGKEAGDGEGGRGSTPRVGGVRSWCYRGTEPIRAIHPLDRKCSTLLYAQGRHFCFAKGPRSSVGREARHLEGNGVAREGVGDGGPSGRRSGEVMLSADVHMGNVSDFRVSSVSRDIVSGGDDGQVHVLSFDPEMAGIPSMKVSKSVGCPVSSVRWCPGQPSLTTWTTTKGHLQILDIRDNRLVLNLKADGAFPVYTHEHLSETIMAVGRENGGIQLFDARKMSAFLTLHDPVADCVCQILPLGSEDCLRDAGASGWVAFGNGGVSRYSVREKQVPEADTSVFGANGLANNTLELFLDASCRTTELDTNAGLFLAPPRVGHGVARPEEHQLCGISRNFSIFSLSK